MKLTVPLTVILTAAFVVTPALAAKKSHKHHSAGAKASCGTRERSSGLRFGPP